MTDNYQKIINKRQIVNYFIDSVLLEDIWYSEITYDYKYVKTIFEKTNFKIMNPISYIEVSNNKSDIIRNKKALKEVYNNLYCKVNKNEKNMKFIDIWLDDRDIKTFASVDFCPYPIKCNNNVYNMWKGFKIDKDKSESSKNIQPFINHLKILCNDNGLDYLIKWLAQLIQQPGTLIGIALIFLSEEGAGKNIFWDYFSEIIGKEYYYETADPVKDLFGRFCNGRKHKLIIDLDEANSKDTFTNSEILKNIITSTHFNYEQKGVDPIELQNFARIIFTTNNILCAKINDNTRRYVIYETSNKMIGNSKYFNEFADYMSNVRNQKAIIEYLRSIDIENVNWIKDRPITETYEALKSVSIDPILKFFANFIEKNFHKKERIITTNELYNDFILFLRDHLKMKEEVINVFTMRILSCQINNKYCNSDSITTGIIRKLNIGKLKQNGFNINLTNLKTYLENKGLCIKDTSSISELRFKSEIEKHTGLVFEKSYPKWLINNITGAQMEIDLYNESQNIAIEYNGYQHYEFPNKFHKTKKEFDDQITRDILKEHLCIAHGMKFIKIKSNDSICEEIEQYKRQMAIIT